eukprot:430659-Pelagomonas_calceolata.AAC.3
MSHGREQELVRSATLLVQLLGSTLQVGSGSCTFPATALKHWQPTDTQIWLKGSVGINIHCGHYYCHHGLQSTHDHSLCSFNKVPANKGKEDLPRVEQVRRPTPYQVYIRGSQLMCETLTAYNFAPDS